MTCHISSGARAKIVLLLMAASSCGGTATADEDALLVRSRAVTAEFASRLQRELQQAMSMVGPEIAISVCMDVAPVIASELSRDNGARVSRTSLRFRNPGNAPEPWQTAVLREFDTGRSTEHFERLDDGSTRYMKAIPTGPICLACHGAELADDVRQRLGEEYPHDRARGYELGDIRGAFSITWPGPVDDRD